MDRACSLPGARGPLSGWYLERNVGVPSGTEMNVNGCAARGYGAAMTPCTQRIDPALLHGGGVEPAPAGR
jgi:hypothetical protein